MDVRCENCQVEYELEDAKLKASGVTVKCANCGHMFRIRKRSPRSTRPGAGSGSGEFDNRITSERPAARADETTQPNAYSKRKSPPPAPFPPADKTPPPAPLPRAPSGPEKGKPARKWLIRLQTGEVQTCRELATLQKWIVAGMVTRKCHISRTGKKWKPLGQITELKMFFDIAEEARHSREHKAVSPPPTRARRTTASKPPPVPRPHSPRSPVAEIADDAPTTPTRPTALGSKPPPPGLAMRPAAPQPVESGLADPLGLAATAFDTPPKKAPEGRDAEPMDAFKPAGAVLREAAERSTGSWAAKGQLADAIEKEEGPAGPVGGMAKGVPVADVAFAGNAKESKLPAVEPDIKGTVEPLPADFGEDFFEPERGGWGKWIVLGSFVVMLGAAAVVYLLVFRDSDPKKAAAVLDAGPTVAASGAVGDAGGTAAPIASGADNGSALIETAQQALHADDTASLRSIAGSLAGAEKADTDLSLVVLRSRVEAALAQQILDRAAANADVAPADAEQLQRNAKKRIGTAAKLASAAVGLDETDTNARVAMADALRLQGKKARDVERWLKKAGDAREAKLVDALLQIRENRLRRARTLLTSLEADGALEKTGDVRPRYRLALLDFAAKEFAKARDAADAVLAVQPGHTGSAVLVERVRAATAVVTSDPMPPEVDDPVKRPNTGGAESYDTLLARADKKAETGKCGAAMSIYQRALDLNPSGVAALTGLGYCHLDASQFASAQAKFRAALGISPRYQEALLGVAEAYQQQGLKDKAIAAFKRFIDEHPTSGRAAQARRQIERLGGKVDDGSGSSDSSGSGETGETGDSSGTETGQTGDTGDSAGSGDTGDTAGDSGDETGGGSESGETGGTEPDKDKGTGGPGAAAIDDLKPSPKPPAAATEDSDDSGN